MPRVLLAGPRPSDAEEFLAMVRASRSLHGEWSHPPRDHAGYEELLARHARPDTEVLFVRRREDGALAGVFVISQIVRRAFQSGYLGYYASAACARQGLMGEGLALVLDHAFGPLGLHRLEANVQPGNVASLALVRRAGFRLEGFSPRYLKLGGRWRDHERWAIVAEEWCASRRRCGRAGATGP